HVPDRRDAAGARVDHDLAAEGPQHIAGEAEARDPERDRHDEQATHDARDHVAHRQGEPREDEPDDVQDRAHTSVKHVRPAGVNPTPARPTMAPWPNPPGVTRIRWSRNVTGSGTARPGPPTPAPACPVPPSLPRTPRAPPRTATSMTS